MTTTSNGNSGSDAKKETGEAGSEGTWAEFFGPVIHSYSRADAVADGYMVEVDAAKSRPFFTLPVAITRSVWDLIVDRGEASESTRAVRLADLLLCAKAAAVKAAGEDLAAFTYEAWGDAPVRASLFLHIGPADTAAPVITIMQPSEL